MKYAYIALMVWWIMIMRSLFRRITEYFFLMIIHAILTEPAETFLYSPDNRHKINQQELSTETNGHQKFQ